MSAAHRAGARAAAPLGVAVALFGVSFGVLARSAGMGVVAPLVMSVTTFAGSAQFAATSVLAGSGGVVAAVLAAVLLNARYVPIGLTVAPDVEGGVLRRFLTAQLLVDESWAIGHLGGGRYDIGRVVGAGVTLYAAWVLGTLVGVAGAAVFEDPAALGFDAAFAALFLALLAPQLAHRPAVVSAVSGAAIAVALTPVTRPGVPIIAATFGVVVGLGRRDP